MSDFAIQVKDLSVVFDDFIAVNKISFDVTRGEIFGFLGANGAGKTTTIRVLCGLLRPSSGDLKVAGVGLDADDRAIKEKVGYMSQKFTLYDDLSVEENLSFVASLRKMNRQHYLKRQKKILDFISFELSLKELVRNLPGGIKQHVSLAAALLHDPEIVFLDEPTAGVSPSSRERFWNLLNVLLEEKKTIFVTTHYMDEAEHCGRIALMGAGEILALDSPANLKSHFFPNGVYELSPLRTIPYQQIQKMRSQFDFFEPYGLHYHVSHQESFESLKNDFSIKKIIPTLEDVFIRVVEANKR